MPRVSAHGARRGAAFALAWCAAAVVAVHANAAGDTAPSAARANLRADARAASGTGATAEPHAVKNAAVEAGRLIYTEGRSPSGARIVGRIGMGDQPIEGVALGCGNCHGADGRGRREGGLTPPDIRWSELTKPYGHRHEQGRAHGPFDERSFERALRAGVDPAGQRLEPAMPRYAMSSKDLASLRAYMQALESLADKGVGATTLRIGTVVPADGPSAPLGELLRALVQRHFDLLNERGGIHGRRLELVVKTLPSDANGAREGLRQWLAAADVFALLAPMTGGLERELSQQASALRLPVVGPLTLYPEDVGASNLMVFHLLPGVVDQAQVLAAHAARELDLARAPVAMWHSRGEQGEARARALAARLRGQGWRDVLLLPIDPPSSQGPESTARALEAQAADLRRKGVGALLVIGTGADVPGMSAALERAFGATSGGGPRSGAPDAAQAGVTSVPVAAPVWLLPASLAGRGLTSLSPAWRDRLWLAFATSPGEEREAVISAIGQFLPDPRAARAHAAPLTAAHGATLLMIEALKRGGHELSRHKLVSTLETMQGVENGVTPRLTFNADRRIGAQGAWLARLASEGNGLRLLPGVRMP